MGVSVWVRLKREIPGVDPLQTDGKLLAKAMDALDVASRELKIRPLSDFYSVSKKQALAELAGEDLSDETWEAQADDHVWWSASDGLSVVDSLIVWVSQNLQKLHRPDDVTTDLRAFRFVLDAAVREKVEFNIAVSV